MKELELVGDSQVIPRLCLLLYAILFEYNIHSIYINRSSTEHVFTYSLQCTYTKKDEVSSGGAPTPAGISVITKHNWDMGMGYLWLNGWGIYHLMGGAFMAYWVGHL